MDEITFDDKTYVSSKRAAQITGYAKDYVGQLCREGRVEARLVGRNWYILETSIREHRFGPSPEKVAEKEQDATWESPNYAPEAVSAMPIIDESHRNPVIDHTTTVQEMQNAWQDWFSQKTQELPPQLEEELLESPEIIESREETQEIQPAIAQQTVEEDPTELVHIVRVAPEAPPEPVHVAWKPEYAAPKHFDIQEKEEFVPIHRDIIPPPVITAPISYESVEQQQYIPPIPVYKPVYGSPRPEGRILRERRVKRKKKPSVALQALLLSIAGIAIAIALIGTGQIDSFLSQSKIQYAPINFFGGENIVNNASK